MKPLTKRFAMLAVAVTAAGVVTACGSSSNSGSATTSSKPVYGGTLQFVSAGDFDHVDPLSAYYVPSFQLEVAWTRQLVSYWPSNNRTKAETIAADVATTVPTKTNGGVSSNGLTYTFHIRPGVDWNSTPARQVTAMDFEREFKAMCNPSAPVGNPLYYVPMIAGMTSYCDAYQNAFKHNSTPTAAQEAAFQNTHSISGISTPNSLTIKFTLTQSANDFLNMMAMPFTSARPVEYDNYLPDSNAFRQHTLSDGPYAITSYTPNKKIVLSRNPAWKQSTDPLRHQYVSQIEVNEGVKSAQTQLDDVEAGTDDLMWDTSVPTDALQSLEHTQNSGLHVYTDTGSQVPYLVFNLQSPDANHAMSKLLVRRAIEYAINKVAIAKIFGGVQLNPILNGAIAPGNVGYTNYDYYPTPDSEGDAALCRQLLRQAGYPHGFTIKDLYRNAGDHPAVFQSVQQDLKSCGITSQGISTSQGTYFNILEDAPNSKKPDQWDISEPGWSPDWLGLNGRANIVPLYQTDCLPDTSNDGCINNATVDQDISDALKAPNEATAAPDWAEAGQVVMKNAYIVPITTQDVVLYVGRRVQHLIYNPIAEQYNVTQLWLSP